MNRTKIQQYVIDSAVDNTTVGVNCPVCGDTRQRLSITKHNTEILYNCFNGGCEVKGRITHGKSFDVLKTSTHTTYTKQTTQRQAMPDDYCEGFLPLIFQQELTKFFITDYKHIGYSPKYNRMIFNFGAQGWMARNKLLKPKWLCFAVNNIIHLNCNTSRVVIVEDCISALRLYSIGVSSISLNRTSFNDSLLTLIHNTYTHALIWLDGDYAGMHGSLKLKSALKGMCNVRCKYTQADPKTFSPKELQEALL